MYDAVNIRFHLRDDQADWALRNAYRIIEYDMLKPQYDIEGVKLYEDVKFKRYEFNQTLMAHIRRSLLKVDSLLHPESKLSKENPGSLPRMKNLKQEW